MYICIYTIAHIYTCIYIHASICAYIYTYILSPMDRSYTTERERDGDTDVYPAVKSTNTHSHFICLAVKTKVVCFNNMPPLSTTWICCRHHLATFSGQI